MKCDQYWEEDSAPYLHGDIQVTLSASKEQEHWTVRDFVLERVSETTAECRLSSSMHSCVGVKLLLQGVHFINDEI